MSGAFCKNKVVFRPGWLRADLTPGVRNRAPCSKSNDKRGTLCEWPQPIRRRLTVKPTANKPAPISA
jgi:hypothetical protein